MDYFFGKLVLRFIGLIGIVLTVVGAMAALGGLGAGASLTPRGGIAAALPVGMAGAVPGMIVSLIGIVLLALVEFAMATFDTATNTKKLIQVAERHLGVSRQALKVGALVVPGYADMGFEERERLLGTGGQPTRSGFLGLFSKKEPDEPFEPFQDITQSDHMNTPGKKRPTALDDRSNGNGLTATPFEPGPGRAPVRSSAPTAET